MKKYDVIIIGAGPGGIFSAYELVQKNADLKVAVMEAGNELKKRRCPIDGKKVKSCIKCKTCAIMNGFGGAGAFSDGKYNITNDFGGTLYEYIGREKAIELMNYVDAINLKYGGEGTKLYSTAGSGFQKICVQNKLKLLNASVRHLGTDINYVVLENLYNELKERSISTSTPPLRSLRRRSQAIWCAAPMRSLSAKTASFPSAEAAASGWKAYAASCRFPPSPTVLTSACVLSCPQSSLSI